MREIFIEGHECYEFLYMHLKSIDYYICSVLDFYRKYVFNEVISIVDSLALKKY